MKLVVPPLHPHPLKPTTGSGCVTSVSCCTLIKHTIVLFVFFVPLHQRNALPARAAFSLFRLPSKHNYVVVIAFISCSSGTFFEGGFLREVAAGTFDGAAAQERRIFFSLSLKQECFAPKCNTKTKLNEKENENFVTGGRQKRQSRGWRQKQEQAQAGSATGKSVQSSVLECRA